MRHAGTHGIRYLDAGCLPTIIPGATSAGFLPVPYKGMLYRVYSRLSPGLTRHGLFLTHCSLSAIALTDLLESLLVAQMAFFGEKSSRSSRSRIDRRSSVKENPIR